MTRLRARTAVLAAGLVFWCASLLAAVPGGFFEDIARDPQTRQQLERRFEIVRPGAVGSGQADTVVPGVSDARNTIARLVQAYPPHARGEAERAFVELMNVYRGMERKYGIPRNDMAGALAAFIAGAYSGYHARSLEDQEFDALVRQMRSGLAAKPAWAGAPLADRQDAFEQLALLGMLTLGTHVALKQNPQAPQASAARSNLRQASKGYLESLLKTSADRVRITEAGLITEAAQAQVQTPANTIEVASSSEIEAIVLTSSWSPSGVGGMVVMNYKGAVLYRDGRYTTDGERALGRGARIDGRWQRNGSGYTLIDHQGKATQVEAKMRARAAQPGQTLAGNYRSLAGAGLAFSGVPSAVGFKNFEFAADGSVRMASGGGAAGETVAAYGKKGAVARYRLDGWTITFTHADGRSEQRLFFLFPDGNRGIGVGGTTLAARG